MIESDNILLRRFAREHAEDAFAELVSRHLSLVYSAALRQVGGDATTAEEIAQSVFSDLARKATSLISHASIVGWLYTATSHVAANHRRADQRRQQREQQAHFMNPWPHDSGGDMDWSELSPVLDEAMHELTDPDRIALLLRFFERKPLRDVGTQLGLGENAARMRVERALERLRQALGRRGVTSFSAALSLALAERTLAEVPAGLRERITPAAISAAAAGGAATGGLLGSLFAWGSRMPRVVLVGAALAVLLLAPWLLTRLGSTSRNAKAIPTPPTSPAETPLANPTSTPAFARPTTPATETKAPQESPHRLLLKLVTADTGQPIPAGPIQVGDYDVNRVLTLRDGTVSVAYQDNWRKLLLRTRVEGFADTLLSWDLTGGDKVPDTYTLRLERAVEIGGTVVDQDGKPLPGAKLEFLQANANRSVGTIETHDLGHLVVEADSEGKWRFRRVTKASLGQLMMSAHHPGYLDDSSQFFGTPESGKALLAGTYVVRLRRGNTVAGVVVDPTGIPVARANVSIQLASGAGRRLKTVSTDDGRFSLTGIDFGTVVLAADAEGFAPTADEIEIAPTSGPLQVTLHRGTPLLLRVTERDGTAIPMALIQLSRFVQNKGATPPLPFELLLMTDAEGRAIWPDAPSRDLWFEVTAEGHSRLSEHLVHPDGQEQVLVMYRPLTVAGTVVDADTGRPIPQIELRTGRASWDETTGRTNVMWALPNGVQRFSNGTFQQTLEGTFFGAGRPLGAVFQVTADGYESFLSRLLADGEGTVRFDIRLRPTLQTTITVLAPDWTPASDAAIALVPAGSRARLKGTDLNLATLLHPDGTQYLRADAQGHFKLTAEGEIRRVVAVHPRGFAEIKPSEFRGGSATWRLSPWGRIEGTAYHSGRPLQGQTLLLVSPRNSEGVLEFDRQVFKRQTDAQGHFVFEHVPPQLVCLLQSISNEDGSHSPYARNTDVAVRPGETTTVTLGVGGCVVTAKLALPPEASPSKPWSFSAVLASGEKNIPLAASRDGSMRGESIEPGTFEFSGGAWVSDAEGNRSQWHSTSVQTVIIPADPANGIVDLGTIPLHLDPPRH